MTSAGDPLDLGGPLLRQLERLALRVRRPVLGQLGGGRRANRPGSSLEFADYRTYVPGDDFRRVDWNAYGRLDRLMLRLFEGEEDTCLNLFVDCSRSMAWGKPEKAWAARRMAGAFAYMTLCGHDRVSVTGFADGAIGHLRPVRGRAAALQAWRFLADLPSSGETRYDSISAVQVPAPGISMIISDFLTEESADRAIARLRSHGQQVILVEVLAPEELRPTIAGDIALRDLENGRRVELTATPAVLAGYQAALDAHVESLRALARAHDAGFHLAGSAEPLEVLIPQTLRRAGILA
ncbi:MAG: hypothetical protein QOK05_342 [Chloroflexota bacterium]|nr:hypothetical protein [Chloroflexota bacterium]